MLFHNWRPEKTETSSMFSRLFTLFFPKFKLITVIIAGLHSWLNERSLLLPSLLYIISIYQHSTFHSMPIKNGSIILLSVKNQILWQWKIPESKVLLQWKYLIIHTYSFMPDGDVINSLLEKWAISHNLRSSEVLSTFWIYRICKPRFSLRYAHNMCMDYEAVRCFLSTQFLLCENFFEKEYQELCAVKQK